MLETEDRILNTKIVLILDRINETSSSFADFIGIPRPVMSHIIKFRNKPSLEIVQKIVAKFPMLGIEWTFDSKSLSEELLAKVAEHYKKLKIEEEKQTLRESHISNHPQALTQILNSQQLPLFSNSNKKIKRIVLIYEDDTFTEIQPSST